jgi:hypothetical protein
MQTGSPDILTLLGTIETEDMGKLERELHDRFEEYWSHYEWFHENEELLTYISKTTAQVIGKEEDRLYKFIGDTHPGKPNPAPSKIIPKRSSWESKTTLEQCEEKYYPFEYKFERQPKGTPLVICYLNTTADGVEYQNYSSSEISDEDGRCLGNALYQRYHRHYKPLLGRSVMAIHSNPVGNILVTRDKDYNLVPAICECGGVFKQARDAEYYCSECGLMFEPEVDIILKPPKEDSNDQVSTISQDSVQDWLYRSRDKANLKAERKQAVLTFLKEGINTGGKLFKAIEKSGLSINRQAFHRVLEELEKEGKIKCFKPYDRAPKQISLV